MTDNDLAVKNFQSYLQINTEQPTPDYEACKQFLFKYAAELGLKTWVHECVTGKPIVGMTLEGTDPSLPVLMLYSHTDVVPTAKDHWTHDPYSAYKDEQGNIYARGAQDMKCVGIQYLEALRRLLKSGKKFSRTIQILWGPDEEIGGGDGMKKFVETSEFKKLNIGFVLDEGLASSDDTYKVYYGERNLWGKSELSRISRSWLQICGKYCCRKIDFDIRIPPTVDLEKFEAQIGQWCSKAGADVKYEFLQMNRITNTTPTTKDDPWWNAFSTVLEELKCPISKEIFIGATDSRYLRKLGYKAIGFSPMINTPVLLHDHNEFLNEKVFIKGIDIYEKLIERLANVAKH